MPATTDLCPAHPYLEAKLDAVAADAKAARESSEATKVDVAKIVGYLGLSGNGGAAGAVHPHHRDDEEAERLHQRATDAIEAARIAALAAEKAAAAVAANAKPDSGTLPPLPLKVWAALAGFVLLVIYLVASDRNREVLPKPSVLFPPAITSPKPPVTP